MEADQFPLNKLKKDDDARQRTKRSLNNEDEENDGNGAENKKSNDHIHSRKKRQAPYLIFPEILCIIDYDGYR